jgi:hypothetical protein
MTWRANQDRRRVLTPEYDLECREANGKILNLFAELSPATLSLDIALPWTVRKLKFTPQGRWSTRGFRYYPLAVEKCTPILAFLNTHHCVSTNITHADKPNQATLFPD